MVSEFWESKGQEELMRRAVKTRELERFRVSLAEEMRQSSYIGAFCLLLMLHPSDGGGESSSAAAETFPLPWVSLRKGLFEKATVGRSDFGLQERTHRNVLLNDFHDSISSLKELASTVTEILDRISKNWALEGAKTIQNGEIRLRKLNRDLTERIQELLSNGSKYGQHVLQCMKKSAFEMDLHNILDDTRECYSQSLRSLQTELKKLEDEEKSVLGRMDSYGRRIFEMLSGCFQKDDTPSVIECLQKVDSVHIGAQIREVEATDLILEIAGIINDIPRTFSGCTSKGLADAEALLRKSYAQSLTCLKEAVA